MSDTVFTTDERGELPDPVTRRPGHRTENIVLADEAEYSLNGKRQDGFQEVVSRINTPFIMRVKAEFSQGDQDLAQQYDVSDNKTVVATSHNVTSNSVDLVVPADHGIKVNQFIQVDQAGVTPATLAAAALGTFQVTNVTDTVVTYAATTGDTATIVENVNIRYQKVRMLDQAEAKVIYSDVQVTTENRILSPAQRGSYRVFASDGTSAQFDSDGTTMNLRGTVAGYSDTNTTAASINLDITGGNVRIENLNAATLTLRIEYSGGAFSDVDQDLFMCLFEKNKEIILKNRTGATRTLALEGIQANVAGRIASSPAQLPAEHPEF